MRSSSLMNTRRAPGELEVPAVQNLRFTPEAATDREHPLHSNASRDLTHDRKKHTNEGPADTYDFIAPELFTFDHRPSPGAAAVIPATGDRRRLPLGRKE